MRKLPLIDQSDIILLDKIKRLSILIITTMFVDGKAGGRRGAGAHHGRPGRNEVVCANASDAVFVSSIVFHYGKSTRRKKGIFGGFVEKNNLSKVKKKCVEKFR
jgi:hypothetical protein